MTHVAAVPAVSIINAPLPQDPNIGFSNLTASANGLRGSRPQSNTKSKSNDNANRNPKHRQLNSQPHRRSVSSAPAPSPAPVPAPAPIGGSHTTTTLASSSQAEITTLASSSQVESTSQTVSSSPLSETIIEVETYNPTKDAQIADSVEKDGVTYSVGSVAGKNSEATQGLLVHKRDVDGSVTAMRITSEGIEIGEAIAVTSQYIFAMGCRKTTENGWSYDSNAIVSVLDLNLRVINTFVLEGDAIAKVKAGIAAADNGCIITGCSSNGGEYVAKIEYDIENDSLNIKKQLQVVGGVNDGTYDYKFSLRPMQGTQFGPNATHIVGSTGYDFLSLVVDNDLNVLSNQTYGNGNPNDRTSYYGTGALEFDDSTLITGFKKRRSGWVDIFYDGVIVNVSKNLSHIFSTHLVQDIDGRDIKLWGTAENPSGTMGAIFGEYYGHDNGVDIVGYLADSSGLFPKGNQVPDSNSIYINGTLIGGPEDESYGSATFSNQRFLVSGTIDPFSGKLSPFFTRPNLALGLDNCSLFSSESLQTILVPVEDFPVENAIFTNPYGMTSSVLSNGLTMKDISSFFQNPDTCVARIHESPSPAPSSTTPQYQETTHADPGETSPIPTTAKPEGIKTTVEPVDVKTTAEQVAIETTAKPVDVKSTAEQVGIETTAEPVDVKTTAKPVEVVTTLLRPSSASQVRESKTSQVKETTAVSVKDSTAYPDKGSTARPETQTSANPENRSSTPPAKSSTAGPVKNSTQPSAAKPTPPEKDELVGHISGASLYSVSLALLFFFLIMSSDAFYGYEH